MINLNNYKIKLENISCNLCKTKAYKYVLKKDNFQLTKCTNCGLVYVNPRPSPKNIKNLYNEDYFIYKNFFQSNNKKMDISQKIPMDKIDKSIQEECKNPLFNLFNQFKIKGNLLDFGCAEGIFLAAAKKMGWNGYGIEISDCVSEFARKKLGLNVISGDINECKFENNFFDIVYLGDVLEHLHDPLKSLSIFYSVLRPGGAIYISTPNFNSLCRFILKDDWRIIAPLKHLYYFTPKSLKKMLSKSGFKISKFKTSGFLWISVLEKMKIIKVTNHRSEEMWRISNKIKKKTKIFNILTIPLKLLLRLTKTGDTIQIIAIKNERTG